MEQIQKVLTCNTSGDEFHNFIDMRGKENTFLIPGQHGKSIKVIVPKLLENAPKRLMVGENKLSGKEALKMFMSDWRGSAEESFKL
jgi:hypothetical protein